MERVGDAFCRVWVAIILILLSLKGISQSSAPPWTGRELKSLRQASGPTFAGGFDVNVEE